MGKVRYKEPSENFEKSYVRPEGSQMRVSIGRESAVGEFYFLSVESLIPYTKQARRYFCQKEIEELSVTIKEHGVQSPLLVTASKLQDNMFEVVSGERRLRASKLVGIEKLPCIVIDDENADEIALVENIQRTDLHPVELADSLNSILSKANWGDISKLADKLGKHHSTISNYLTYARLPDHIKDHLIHRNIKSRDILRRIVKSESVEKMENILGISGNHQTSVFKSILRISMDSENIKIQDKNIDSLTYRQRALLKENLQKLLKRIEGLD